MPLTPTEPVACLFPDCDFTADDADLEQNKRVVIDHINHEHTEAHVICACVHDNQHLEDVDEEVVTPSGERLTLHRARYQCVRCGGYTLTDREVVEGEQDAEAEG